MSSPSRVCVFLAAGWILGCGGGACPEAATTVSASGQTYPQAVSLLCNVDQAAGLRASEDDPIARARERSVWIAEHVDNPDGIYLRTVLSVRSAAEQATTIRDEAKKVGLSRCALADSLEHDTSGALAP